MLHTAPNNDSESLLESIAINWNALRHGSLSWQAVLNAITSVPGIAWTLLSMALMIGLYSHVLGWPLAAGLTGLLLVHECGHLVAAFMLGIPVSAPIFVPYAGAIIDLKEEVENRWKLALMGIAGPIAGTAGALGCFVAYRRTGDVMCASLAAGACIQNLFNLIPVGSLDGGHIVGAITRWIWIPGYLLMSWLAWHVHTPVVSISLIVLLPQVLGVLRPYQRRSQNWRRPSTTRRSLLGVSYLGLVLLLTMMLTHVPANGCFGGLLRKSHASEAAVR